MRQGIESGYADRLDRKNEVSPDEITEQGLLAEELVVNSINSGKFGLEARMSTLDEDSGKQDIGMRQIIDAVAYKEGRAVMGIQITTAQDPKTRQKKMMELMARPFLRLPEMKNSDMAIPKVLVYLDRETVKAYKNDPEFSNNPEVVLQIMDGILKSLEFDATKTKNPNELNAIKQLMNQIKKEKEKLIH